MTQFLLSTAVTITTVLLIIVSVQLISLLNQLKKDHFKQIDHVIKRPEIKKNKVVKRRVNLISLLAKMKSHISNHHSPKKKFFKSI